MAIEASASSLSLASPRHSAKQPLVLLPHLNSYFLNGGGTLKSVPSKRFSSNRWRFQAIRIQMNLFERLSRVVKSYANAAISSLEDPEKILDQAVLEMNDDLVKMRQSTAQVIASQRLLGNKYKAAEQASEDWYKRAQLALQKGQEDLAREALKRRKSYADSASSLKTQLDQQKSIVESLISNSKSKIQEAKSKKDTLKARAQTAKTATKVNEILGNVNTSSALSAFEKMEEKVLTMESQAEALNELSADELDGKFAMLETPSVDDDLTKLKMELSGFSLILGAVTVLAMIALLVLISLFSTTVAIKIMAILIMMVALSAAVLAALSGAVAAVSATTVMAAAIAGAVAAGAVTTVMAAGAATTAISGLAIAVVATATWVGVLAVAVVASAIVAVALSELMLGRRQQARQQRRFLQKNRWW